MKKVAQKQTIAKQKKVKNISLDELAVMVQGGFIALENNLNSFKEEMSSFKNEMYSFKKNTESALYKLDQKTNEIDERLKRIELSLEPISVSYGVFSREIRDLNSRVAKLEKVLLK
jgi:archaellum component FlaC